MTQLPPVGKKELLHWAQRISKQKCTQLADLKNGVIILKCCSTIWPKVIDLRMDKWKAQPTSEWEVRQNWDLVERKLRDLRLPMDGIFDRKAIMTGRFKQCYTFLVMLYFLQNLSHNHEFSVDFAHPIDSKLAAFLQSTASVECLARGGGLRLEDIPGMNADYLSETMSQYSSTSKQTQPYPYHQIPEPQSRPTRPTSGYSIHSMGDDPSNLFSMDIGFQGDERQSLSSINSYQIEKLRDPADSSAFLDEEFSQVKMDDAVPVGMNKCSVSAQTMFTSRKLEKLMIRSMKTKKMLEDAYQTIEKLSKGDTSLNMTSMAEIDSKKVGIVWKNEKNKLKGELLLTKMRYEIDALNRKIGTITQQKEYGIKELQHKLQEIQKKHQNEILYQRDKVKNEASNEQLLLVNQRLKDQNDFQMELEKIRKEIAFEADRIRQGGLQDEDDAIEDEILRLRQLTITQSNQIKAAEDSNQQLKTLANKLQNEMDAMRKKNEELHDILHIQDQELYGELMQQYKMKNNELSKNERFLLSKCQKMQDELNSLQANYKSETEHLKYELFKYSQQPASKILQDAMESEFDKDQEIDRLKSVITRLKRANAFLRDRSVVFDKLNSSTTEEQNIDEDQERESIISGYTNNEKEIIWTPSPFIGETPEDMDLANSEALKTLKRLESVVGDEDRELVEDCTKNFWKLISNQAIFIQRIKKARNMMNSTHREKLQQTRKQQREKIDLSSEIEKIKAQQRVELEELKHKFLKDQASIIVKLQLTEDSLRNCRDEVFELPKRYAKVLENTMIDDEQRFSLLTSKLHAAREEISAYRLREKLWTQLIECQRKNIELTEQLSKCQDYNQAVRLNKQRETLDLEATSCVQQLQALTQQHHEGARIKANSNQNHSDDIDGYVREATMLLKTQLAELSNKVEDMMKEREHAVDRMNGFEQQTKELQFELAKAQKNEETIRQEFHDLLERNKALNAQVQRMREDQDDEISNYKVKIQQLKEEMKENQH